MFETAELGLKVDKEEFEQEEPGLRTQLLRLQREIARTKTPVLILIHGVDGSGRGAVLNLLHEWLDARYLLTYAPTDPTEEERQRPEYWRYWMNLPARGQIGIAFGSWYTTPIRCRAYGETSEGELDVAMTRARAFEQALVDDGGLVVKLWLHISKKEQKKLFERIEADRQAPWPVTKQDWRHLELYSEFRRAASRALRQTSTGEAPWTIIEAGDARHRDITVVRHLIERFGRHVERLSDRVPSPNPSSSLEISRQTAENAAPAVVASGSSVATTAGETSPSNTRQRRTVLDTLDLSRALDDATYDTRLKKGQARLNRLARRAFRKKLGTILVFEGWDAAGKGGAIRRVAQALDARDSRIIPIAAPTDEEKAHHYLWRFWRHLPRLGRTTIYDRSWYGRVLVERVEGYATEQEWGRAYQEINDFEEQLVEFGVVLVKFWMHISKDEQIKRFEERASKPWKQHKISEEDYRNRGKWAAYEEAVTEMIARTSTEYSPWVLVEGNDKRFARVKVLDTVCSAMEAALERR